jgi:hypothetical protein
MDRARATEFVWTACNPPPPAPKGGTASGFEGISPTMRLLVVRFTQGGNTGYEAMITQLSPTVVICRVPPEHRAFFYERALASRQ